MLDELDYSKIEDYINKIDPTYATAKPFLEFSIEEFIIYLDKFNFTRNISAVHIHHTWRPNYSNFTGTNHQNLQKGMENFHIQSGFGQIAQHITIFPDGKILLGRSFNVTPASISNHNTGAFCIEQIGDFDQGKDKVTPAQLKAVLEVSRWFVKHKNTQIIFHNERSTKTCPGSGYLPKEEFMSQVNNTNDYQNHWAKEDIEKMKELGIMSGFPDGSFKPDEILTRAQFASSINRLLKLIGSTNEKLFK